MSGNSADLYDNPAVNYSVSKIIESYNWSNLAYGFDSDYERIQKAHPTLTFSDHELMAYYVRLFLHKSFPDKPNVLPLLNLTSASKAVSDFLDSNARELIKVIAKQQILDGKDSSHILLHFLTIPELERFYGKLIPHGFPSVVIATSYMISEVAIVCYDSYVESYTQRLGMLYTPMTKEKTSSYA